MTRHRLVTLAVGVTAVALALSACGGGTSGGTTGTTTGGGSASGAALTIGMPNGSQTDNSNPFAATSSANSLGYAKLIYEPLAMTNQVNPSEDPTPWLATAWTWNADYTQIDFTIRDGVKWSDGQDLTAADVAYTMNLRKSNDAVNPDALPFKDITVDGNKVSVTFESSQYINQLKVVNQFIVPEHIWKDIADPATDLNQKPIGSGPYVLDSWTAQAVTMKVNDSYWGDKPQVPEVRYTSYNDNTALTTALVNGDVQWGWVFIADYQNVFEAKDPDHYKTWFPTGLSSDVLFLNTETKPFNDVAVRKAVNMVIDRSKISTQASSDAAPPITSVVGLPEPAGTPFIDPQYAGKTLSVDVEGAKKVLSDAGYTLDGDTLKDPDGEAVTFTLQNPAGWNDYLTGLQIIADSVKALGIKADVQAPNADNWTNDVANGNFQATLHWTDSGATPWNFYANIMDGEQLKPIGTAASWNFGRFKSDDATKALKDYANASDDATRTAALKTLEQIFVDEAPAIASTGRPAFGNYSTKNYVGWPDADNAYAAPNPTLAEAAMIILKLTPAS